LRGAPSSTEIKIFESGLSAIADIFFRFSNANVKDLLLSKTGQRR
jgi:hypothetical protein